MPRYHTVVFDCDGTLIDSIADLAAAGNVVCAAHGWPTFTVSQYKHKVGNGQRTLVRRIMPTELVSDSYAFEQAYEEFNAYYALHKSDTTAPYAGILEMLDTLRAAGVRLAVLTNKNDGPAQELVRGYFGDRFACVQGRVEGLPPKPAPDLMRALLGRLAVDTRLADACLLPGFLMVGDSDVDIQAGQAVGMDTCGVLWGFRDRVELEGAGATHIVATPADLTAIVLGEDPAKRA